jgi:hypothetical protein
MAQGWAMRPQIQVRRRLRHVWLEYKYDRGPEGVLIDIWLGSIVVALAVGYVLGFVTRT